LKFLTQRKKKNSKVLYRPGVNIINSLQAAFTPADHNSAKKTVKLSVFFSILGSAGAKAAQTTLMKLTPFAAKLFRLVLCETQKMICNFV